MPVLNWIGKEAVVKHHKEVPFRLLEPVAELSCGDGDSGNLIVQGDNLHALKALLPRYAGQVKCIYIDPPYNTGNEGWAYNDNVKSPEILKWLGEVVGREGETLDRHDRWLCMMYPRLLLLKQFLREDGAIFVSIDDNEVSSLKFLLDEIFGGRNLVSILSWFKRVSPANDAKYFSTDHEYVAVYANNKELWRPNKLERTASQLENYRNPDNDPRGVWNSATYTCNKSADERPNLFHPVTNPNTNEVVWPRRTAVWKYDAERHKQNERDGLLYWGVDGRARMPRLKKFLTEMGDVVPRSILPHETFGHTQEARTELLGLIDESSFVTPKPSRLIQRLLQIGSDKDSLVLDSFAGSGTTGHAVLKQNSVDGGNRKFILVEMDEKIARDVTAERVRRVATGYTKANGERVDGLGGGFQYYGLSTEPLFLADGRIRETVTFAELAEFVWFMETGAGHQSSPPYEGGVAPASGDGVVLSSDSTQVEFTDAENHPVGETPTPLLRKEGSPESALLGKYKERAVFLLYNGILKDKTDIGGNVLNGRTLEYIDGLLPDFDGTRVIYGARTRFDKKKLMALGITFHQLPYDLATKSWF